ncbi:MAG: hypothetical protein AB1894_22325 [Chloroflexota bacterium]
MKKNLSKFVLFFTAILIIASCSGKVSQSPQSTYIIPLATASVQSTSVVDQIRETTTPQEPVPQPDDIGYFEGAVTITQYYTFLGHGHYEEAYLLLSSTAQQRSQSLDDFIEKGKRWFVEVEIITILPYHIYVKEQGGRLRSADSITERRYFVQIIAWGEGRMTGSRLSGEVQDLFLRIIKEDGKWRIDAFSTAPL